MTKARKFYLETLLFSGGITDWLLQNVRKILDTTLLLVWFVWRR